MLWSGFLKRNEDIKHLISTFVGFPLKIPPGVTGSDKAILKGEVKHLLISTFAGLALGDGFPVRCIQAAFSQEPHKIQEPHNGWAVTRRRSPGGRGVKEA